MRASRCTGIRRIALRLSALPGRRLSRPGGELLLQLRDQRADMAAIALDDRAELVALRHLHADAADINVGDPISPGAADQIPIDPDRGAVAADDLAVDDGLVAAPARTGNPERLAGIFGQPGAVGAHDVFLEH